MTAVNYRRGGPQTKTKLSDLLKPTISQLKQSEMKSTEKLDEVSVEDLLRTGQTTRKITNDHLPQECLLNGSKNTQEIEIATVPNFLVAHQQQSRAASPLTIEDENFLELHNSTLATGNIKIFEEMSKTDLTNIENRLSVLERYLYNLAGSTVEQVAVELETLAQTLNVRETPTELGLKEYYRQLCPLPYNLMLQAFDRIKEQQTFRSFPTPAAITKTIEFETNLILQQHNKLKFVKKTINRLLDI